MSFALATLGEEAPGAALKRASRQMAHSIERGGTWSQALGAHPALFSEAEVALLEAAEHTGSLAAACLTLAEAAEREYEIHQCIKRETWYPKLLLLLSLVLAPFPIRVGSLEISFAAQLGSLALAWGVWKIANYLWPVGVRGGVRRLIDRFRSRFPIANKIVRGFALARFLRVLGETGEAGVEWPRGVLLGADACGNAHLAARLRPVSVQLRRGQTLFACLAATGEIPPLAMSLLQSGEVSGQLNAQLQVAAHFLEEDAKTALHEAVQALNMTVFLLAALKIGVLVVQFWQRMAG